MVRLVSNASSIEYDAACAFEYNAFTLYWSGLIVYAKRRFTLEATRMRCKSIPLGAPDAANLN